MPDRLGEGRDLPGRQIAGQDGKRAPGDGLAEEPGHQSPAPGRPGQHSSGQPSPPPRPAAHDKAASGAINATWLCPWGPGEVVHESAREYCGSVLDPAVTFARFEHAVMMV